MIQSLNTILFNYNKALKQADQLDALARQLEGYAKNDMSEALSHVSSNWKGESASQFIAKGNKAKQDIQSSAKQLHNVATAIRKAAETVRRAEERAREIALIQQQKLSGGGGSSGGAGASRSF